MEEIELEEGQYLEEELEYEEGSEELEIGLEDGDDTEELELEDSDDELEVELEVESEGDSEGDTEEELAEYEGEDGRPYSEYEKVGTNETVRGDEGVLRIYHKSGDEGDVDSARDNYQDRMTEYTEKVQAGGTFEGFDGDPIKSRLEDGNHRLTMLSIDKLVFLGSEEERLRQASLEIMDLETSIEELGQIEPIIVVPLGSPIGYDTDENGEEIEELPLHDRYQVIHGRRRVEAMANLGHDYIEAIIDTTLPRELLELYQATATTNKELTFSEKMAYIKRMRLKQPEMSPDLLEASVGFKVGELPKAEFVDSYQTEFSDIYFQVEKEKLTIEQGFTKIDKEITKREKEAEKEALEGSDGQDVEDELRDKQNQGLDEMQNSAGKQELGNRKILDTALRRSVEARDSSQCQVCGYAQGFPERADNLKAHHMVAVQYGGSDSLDNLIMLCNNCHEEVHKYEKGRQVYYQETFDKSDEVKKIVVLGNILRRARVKAIKHVRDHDSNIGKQMDSGKTTVGKALQKLGVDLKVEETFIDNSPYKEFKQTTADLDYGGTLTGELAEVWEFEEEDIVGTEDENLEEPEIEVNVAEEEEELGDIEEIEDISIEELLEQEE